MLPTATVFHRLESLNFKTRNRLIVGLAILYCAAILALGFLA